MDNSFAPLIKKVEHYFELTKPEANVKVAQVSTHVNARTGQHSIGINIVFHIPREEQVLAAQPFDLKNYIPAMFILRAKGNIVTNIFNDYIKGSLVMEFPDHEIAEQIIDRLTKQAIDEAFKKHLEDKL